jgi:multisubunit Na+/H+ antiporter MnhG subunit
MLDEIKKIRSDRKALKDFGLTIGMILMIFGFLALWRGRSIYPYFLAVGALFAVSGLIMPRILKIPNAIWMAFSVIIGFFMSRVILTILFYGVITPISVLTKVLGKDILDQKIDRTRPSYWIARQDRIKTKESYEKQY